MNTSTHHLAVHGVYARVAPTRGREQCVVHALDLGLHPSRGLFEHLGEIRGYWVTIFDHLLEREHVSYRRLLLRALCCAQAFSARPTQGESRYRGRTLTEKSVCEAPLLLLARDGPLEERVQHRVHPELVPGRTRWTRVREGRLYERHARRARVCLR